jgi:integrase
MSTFSAEQLAQILYPQELEILEEIAYEFEDPDDQEPDAPSRPVLSHNLAHLIVQASHDLHGYRGPKSKKTKSKKKTQTKKNDNLSPLDRERFDELGEEIKRDEMGKRRLPAVPTRDEVRNLLQTAHTQDDDINKRDYLIIRLMYATGCRRSELEKMRWPT